MKIGWYKVTKKYRNGEDVWALYISKKHLKDCWFAQDTEEGLAEYIGENTSGGHNYGWSVDIVEIPNYVEGMRLLIIKPITSWGIVTRKAKK